MICSTDPIADMLTRIRNALLVNQAEISLPHSHFKEDLARILAKQGFLLAVKVSGKSPHKTLLINLRAEGDSPRVSSLTRISKPGRRVYVGYNAIPRIKNGRGIVIMSTSRGLMTGPAARRTKIGGEVVCSVY